MNLSELKQVFEVQGDFRKSDFKMQKSEIGCDVLYFVCFSQKQTSWVFNDQPCECADVGHRRKIGRAAKMGWEKIWLPAMIAGHDCRPCALLIFQIVIPYLKIDHWSILK